MTGIEADSEGRGKMNWDKQLKQQELAYTELQGKADEQAKQIADLAAHKSRCQAENSELLRTLEEVEAQINATQRLQKQIANQARFRFCSTLDACSGGLLQVEEARRGQEEEARERSALLGKAGNAQHEVEALRADIEAIGDERTALQRELSKTNAEIQQWKARYEGEGLLKGEDVSLSLSAAKDVGIPPVFPRSRTSVDD